MRSTGLRWVGVITGVPFTLGIGLLLAGWIAGLLGVWDYYVAAVMLPVVGLTYAWIVAPERKPLVCAMYTLFGLYLAALAACPASFPEWHPRAYETTYVPFVVTCATTAACFVLLVTLARPRA